MNERGRAADDMCMTRDDPEGPWSKKNTIILVRKDHLARQNAMNAEKRINLKPKYKKIRITK